MTRPEMMRRARQSAQVTFSEYLKIRNVNAPTLVFEGKQCPVFYVGKVAAIIGRVDLRQLIVRGKANVLELRELVKRNISTAKDLLLYFVDRDFDEGPVLGDYPDVYVTRGYSIENELISWPVVESFIRSNFDIADYDDEAAIADIRREFYNALASYLLASKTLHKMVYACRREAVDCFPTDKLGDFFDIELIRCEFKPRFASIEELANLLKIAEKSSVDIAKKVAATTDFDSLDQNLRWRGKYHFDFLQKYLTNVAASRRLGQRRFQA